MTMPASHASIRGSRLHIRLTEIEHAQLQREAERDGVSVSELVRARVLRTGQRSLRATMQRAAAPPSFQAMDPALFAELSRIGNNLNQVARALNSGQGGSRAEVVRLVSQVWQAVLQDEVTARYFLVAEGKVRAKVQPG